MTKFYMKVCLVALGLLNRRKMQPGNGFQAAFCICSFYNDYFFVGINMSLSKDYKLPHIDRRETINLIALFVIPNAIFLSLAGYLNLARPLVNLDYFVAIAFLFARNKGLKAVGFLLFILSCLFDILMLVIQIFPFMDLSAIRYFMPFIWVAPKMYLIAMGLGTILTFGLPLILQKVFRQQNYFYLCAVSIVMILVGSVVRDFKYRDQHGVLARTNYYYTNSQAWLYYELTNSAFVAASTQKAQLVPLKADEQGASRHLKTPYASKILFVVVESLGAPKQPELQQELFKNITAQTDKLDFVEMGKNYALGATVQGELRELCGMDVRYGFGLGQLDSRSFSGCLPHKLTQSGYKTIAMHGSSGRLYDRYAWYPKADFQQTIFAEQLLGLELKRCAAFKGICDTELTQHVIPKQFQQHQNDKLFFYWLTLTAHAPYEEEDIVNKQRVDCTRFGMNPNGQLCHNMQLEAQTMDGIADLIKQPEMKGVEVMIVGDHMPPIVDDEDFRPLLNSGVSWLHFKIKD